TKTPLLSLFLAVSLLGSLQVKDSYRLPSFGVALADPPPWAPAHGWRRKHGGDHDDQGDDDDRGRVRPVIDREAMRRKFEEEMSRVFPHYHEFVILDANHDGRISLQEWREAEELFAKLDRNHDGYLTRDEYEHVDEQRGFLSGLLYSFKRKVASL